MIFRNLLINLLLIKNCINNFIGANDYSPRSVNYSPRSVNYSTQSVNYSPRFQDYSTRFQDHSTRFQIRLNPAEASTFGRRGEQWVFGIEL